VPEGYQCVGTRHSHCDFVALLIKREWIHHTTVRGGIGAPAVIAIVNFASDRKITFGSCHLAPYNGGKDERLYQMETILQNVENDANFILAGDVNMRKAEDLTFETLGVRDAWKETGETYGCKFTWDSTDHSPKDRPGTTGPHNRYHGPNAFQFKCRFDRVYFRGADLSADSFNLMANQPLTTPFHFLSDHFGMVATFRARDTGDSQTCEESSSTRVCN